jgi:hypothetical protein
VEDKIVIFTGDLLDSYRKENDVDGHRGYEYIYEEVKIFLFLKALREQALRRNSDILLILGNHEFLNLYKGDVNQYITPYADYAPINYKGTEYSRRDFFAYNGPGAELIGFSGYRLFIILNNIFIAHTSYVVDDSIIGIGDKNPKYNLLISDSQLIEDSVIDKVKFSERDIDGIEEEIFTRKLNNCDRHNYLYGLEKDIINDYRHNVEKDLTGKPVTDEEIRANIQADKIKECENINKRITSICDNDIDKCGRQNIMIMGHDTQDYATFRNRALIKVMSHSVVRDTATIEYFPPFAEINANEQQEQLETVTGSINIECEFDDREKASIYKIDVAMSKAFDVNMRLPLIFFNAHFATYMSKLDPEHKVDIKMEIPPDATPDDEDRINNELHTKLINKIKENGIKTYNSERGYELDRLNLDDSMLMKRYGVRNIKEYLVSYMRGRCPSVLHIKFNEDSSNEVISVIRSSLRNTLTHQPRADSFDYPIWLTNEFLKSKTTDPLT